MHTTQAAQANPKLTTWSKPFYGITHLGGYARWVTVADRGYHAELSCNHRGCGFNALQSTHRSVDDAKAAGEKWLAANGGAA